MNMEPDVFSRYFKIIQQSYTEQLIRCVKPFSSLHDFQVWSEARRQKLPREFPSNFPEEVCQRFVNVLANEPVSIVT